MGDYVPGGGGSIGGAYLAVDSRVFRGRTVDAFGGKDLCSDGIYGKSIIEDRAPLVLCARAPGNVKQIGSVSGTTKVSRVSGLEGEDCGSGNGPGNGILRGVQFSKSCTTIYVGNIPPTTSTSNLKHWFSNFGDVVDVYIPKKKSKVGGLSFAFVRFRHEFEAILACEKVNGLSFNGYAIEVNISKFPRLQSLSSSGVPFLQNSNGGTHGVQPTGVKASEDMDAAHLFSRSTVGDVFMDGVDGAQATAYSRYVPGCSYAKIVQSGGNSCGVLQDCSYGGLVSDAVIGKSVALVEDPGHLAAVMYKNCGPMLNGHPLDYLFMSESSVKKRICSEYLDNMVPRANQCKVSNVLTLSEITGIEGMVGVDCNEGMVGVAADQSSIAKSDGMLSLSECADHVAADVCLRGIGGGRDEGYSVSGGGVYGHFRGQGVREPNGEVNSDVVVLDGYVCNDNKVIPWSRGLMPDQILAPKGYHIINRANFEAVTNGLIDGVLEAFELGESVGIDIPDEVKSLIIAVMDKRQVFLKTLFDNG